MTKFHDVTLDIRISKEQAQHLFLLNLDNIKRLYADQPLSELEKVLFERIQVSLDERRDAVSDLYSKLDRQAVTIEGLENEITNLTDKLEANYV